MDSTLVIALGIVVGGFAALGFFMLWCLMRLSSQLSREEERLDPYQEN